jgi:CubicO group peptidase (beta-lactamase class C family)
LLPEPGHTYQYTDVTPQLATGVVTYAAKTSALEFAEEALLRPMGFRNHEWMHQDSVGIDNGAYGLRLRPIDMQKLGVLYEQRGVWNHHALLSSAWVERAFSPWLKTSARVAEPNYGWYWESIDFTPTTSRPATARSWLGHVASGWKGQRLAVFAEQNIVVTMTGVIEAPEDETALFHRIVTDYVIRAVEGTRASPAMPDPALRERLAAAIDQARHLAAVHDLEPRMVPSVALKQAHHGFKPD